MLDMRRLGDRIQHARAERGITLQELADRAGVSVSMLSAVERAAKAPTIVVLSRIADGLRIPLSHLVTEPSEAQVIVRRAAEQEVTDHAGGWRRTIVSPVVPGVNFELLKSELPAGCDAGTFPAYASGSHEYVVVESGLLRLRVGSEHVDLDAGDSAYFAADVVHGYANPTDEVCVYYVAALIMRSRR